MLYCRHNLCRVLRSAFREARSTRDEERRTHERAVMKEQKIERRNFLKYAAAATIASPFLSDSKISLAGRSLEELGNPKREKQLIESWRVDRL